MKIQINTGHNIDGREAMARRVDSVVTTTLGHLAGQITRVEVHLSDENNEKGGNMDKRCVMEARLEGHHPIAVKDEAETIHQAITGATQRMKQAVAHLLDRLHDRQVSAGAHK